MENYSYSSYPESHDSSPRSRDNESWDDQQPPPSSYKVKFMCSYGGKIHPRPHDNQLAYVGGETKILAVDRNIRFSSIVSKLSCFCSGDYNEVCFKYQLPGEDLDALISVTNDEDLEHMMLEYDRLYRSGGSRPARLRLFLFPLTTSNQSSFSADDPKPNQQWFVDALNSVPIQSIDSSSSIAASPSATDSDFLFGFEKQRQPLESSPISITPLTLPLPLVNVTTKLPDPKIETVIPEAKIVIGDDRNIVGGESMYEIERQIHDLQRLQISKQEHQQQQQQQAAMFQRKNEENLNLNLPRGAGFHGDYYMPDKPAVPVAVPVPAAMSIPPTAYWQQQQDRHMSTVTGGYPDPITATERLQQLQQQQQQQQVYLIPSQAGMYQTPAATNTRQVIGQVGHGGQGYYGQMQRVLPDVYREQQIYSMGPPPGQQQMQQQAQQQQAQMQKMMMGEAGQGVVGGGGYTTTQVGYDSTGRQVYYTTTTTGAPSGGGVPSSYPTAVTTMPVDPRQTGPLNQDGKVLKPAQV